LAAVASAALLCRHSLNLETAAKRIEAAILKLLNDGYRPADLYNEAPKTTLVNTQEISDQLLTYIGQTENV